jgi:ABC-type transport system involved in cytochrome bd biosynthesis fused ATPase/permease subunit
MVLFLYVYLYVTAPGSVLTITVFSVWMRFSSAQKTRLARAARRFCENLRGRKTVRADRRLRTDEKHIRAQSAIFD